MNVIQTIRNYLELCRIQFAGFGILCVVGAMTVVGAELTLMQFLPLFAVHVLTIAWSFAHNDYCDYEIDRHGEAIHEGERLSEGGRIIMHQNPFISHLRSHLGVDTSVVRV